MPSTPLTKRLPIFGILSISILLSFSLVAVRMYFSGQITYCFLVWNLFLAFVPFAISTYLVVVHCEQPNPSKWVMGSSFFVWLLFFPNAPYILTDLFHLKARTGVPLWFDLVLLLSFAWNGLILGLLSLMDMQTIVQQQFNRITAWFFAFFVLGLGSFGIYLGRYLRWNSWDILTNPMGLLHDIFDRMVHPMAHPRTIAVTLLFTVFLSLIYLTLQFLDGRSRMNDNYEL